MTDDTTPGKFEGCANQTLAEELYQLTMDGSCETDGETAAPTGFFAIIEDYGDPAKSYILVEDDRGFVSVQEFEHAYQALELYASLREQYEVWNDDVEDEYGPLDELTPEELADIDDAEQDAKPGGLLDELRQAERIADADGSNDDEVDANVERLDRQYGRAYSQSDVNGVTLINLGNEGCGVGIGVQGYEGIEDHAVLFVALCDLFRAYGVESGERPANIIQALVENEVDPRMPEPGDRENDGFGHEHHGPSYGQSDGCKHCGQDIQYVGTGDAGPTNKGLGWFDRGGNFHCQDGTHTPHRP